MRLLGYVLASRPYRETSLLLELFTHEEGRSAALARGVRAAKETARRAAIEPFRLLAIECRGRGELKNLAQVEVLKEPPVLGGRRLFAGLYLNELLYRLLPRRDPYPRLFLRYAQSLNELAENPRPGWSLLRFERDVLAELGYGLELEYDAQGRPIRADRFYRFDPQGAPQPSDDPSTFPGAAFLALAADEAPPLNVERACRRLMSTALAAHFPVCLRSPRWFAALASLRRSAPVELTVDDRFGPAADPNPIGLDQELDARVVADFPPLADP